MLETKFVKHLQSRPAHVRMFIFVFTMATAAAILFYFLAASINNTFLSATQSKSSSEKIVVVSEDNKKQESLPSLWNNMKANIGELSGVIAGAFSALGSDSENSITNSKIEKVRQIKPVKLPTEKQ